MIDFHNHVLPSIDDGSQSLEMTLEMLECAYSQGITDVVNTVHYKHPKVEKTITYDFIKSETQKLTDILKKNNILINIHVGSEILYYSEIMELKDDLLATFGNGKYMLIEFLPHLIPNGHKNTLFDLKINGITPIIAHPERYKFVQNNLELVYDWLNMGCIIQIDAGSLTGKFGRKAKTVSKRIIEKNLCQIIGSDAHDNKKRNFALKKAFQIAQSILGDKAKTLVYDNPRAVIEGDKIVLDLFDYPLERNGLKIIDKLKFLFK